jgi:tRNA threonylcarbamoyladenosine biosynthesis protein TsaE
MKIKFHTISSAQTSKLAQIFAENIKNKTIILLRGNLGSGKTTFAQGFAQGLGIKEIVNSPTFNIVKVYNYGKSFLYHIDAYRLENNQKDIGLNEYINSGGHVLIEWPEFVSKHIPKNNISIEIINEGDEKRTINVEANGESEKAIVMGVNKKWATNY